MNRKNALAVVTVLENALRELRAVVEREWRDEVPGRPASQPTPSPPATSFPKHEILLRIPQILQRLPISASTWWRWVQTGRAPKGIKLSERVTAWKASDIDALVRQLQDDPSQSGRLRSTIPPR